MECSVLFGRPRERLEPAKHGHEIMSGFRENPTDQRAQAAHRCGTTLWLGLARSIRGRVGFREKACNAGGSRSRWEIPTFVFSNYEGGASPKPNMNIAWPADTTTTGRPPTVNEIGGASVLPPRKTRHSSCPVVESSANTYPADAPKTNPPSVASRPLYWPGSLSIRGEKCSHLLAPVAASSA